MKVLVTGANGFLGRYVISALREAGHAVRAMVRAGSESGRWGREIDLFPADLCEATNLEAAFEGIDVLVHLAARLMGTDEQLYAAAVTGTERLMQAMHRSATRRLVLASSFSVYDWGRVGTTLTEASVVAEHNAHEYGGYTIAKVCQERTARRYSREYGWDLTVLRPGAIWGAGRLDLPDMGPRIGPFLLVIAPRAPMRLTYVENCATAFVNSAQTPGATSETFNVVDGQAINTWRYAGEYLRRTGAACIRVPVSYRLGLMVAHMAHWTSRWLLGGRVKLPSILMPRRFEARFKPVRHDCEKLRRGLEWEPQWSFAQALDRAVAAAATSPPGAAAGGTGG